MLQTPSLRLYLFLFVLLAPALQAAGDRIRAAVDEGRRIVLKGQVHPRAQARYDRGPVDPALELDNLSLILRPADGLEAFLARQQDPGSPDYRRWLTPEQFAGRFGASPNDIAKLVSWLQSQGLQVRGAARGRLWITFSGSAERIGRALGTEIHRYVIDGRRHFANAGEPSIPAAFAQVVAGVHGLDDFGMQSMIVPAADPQYNSGSSHYLAPADFATIYNLPPNLDGTGQKIAVMGQTNVDISDIQAFRTRFNLPQNNPQQITDGTNPGTSADDVPEADLDLEWAGAVAPKATILYVTSRSGVFAAFQYAVDRNLAPVISMSYGACEQSSSAVILRGVAQQANAQGITFVVASGDTGAADCDYDSPTPQVAKGPTLSYPASYPEVTAVGGTRFDEGAGAYWDRTNGPNSGSALSYIPERAWNDAVERNDLSAGGGGPSALFTKPAWQNRPGIPQDGVRDIPDVSLAASPQHDAYLVITGGSPHAFGGTSASAPAFAGILALLNQALTQNGTPAQPGLGNINPALYRLAQAAPDAFHDVTAGDIKLPCVQGSPSCIDGSMGFSAGSGYDMATGLGSVDAGNLIAKWATATSTATTLSVNPGSANLGDTVQLTATVTGVGGAVPSGLVTFLASDDASGWEASLGSANLSASGGAAVATLSVPAVRIAAGDGTVWAVYSGGGVFDPSAVSATVAINKPSSGSMVVPSISPNPVYQVGSTWPYTITLSEKAGVATTLSGFTVDGTQNSWNAQIPAGRTISRSLSQSNLAAPVNRVFVFTGTDRSGQPWSQQITVPFVVAPGGPLLAPAITLISSPSSVIGNPQAPASCRFAQRLTVQEQSGYSMQLTTLTGYSGSVQQLFGTTSLAPFGSLHADLCWNDSTALGTKALQLAGVSENGNAVTAAVSVQFLPAADSTAVPSVSPDSLSLAATAGAVQTAALDLSFAGQSPAWMATVLPANRTTSWLTLSPASGTGAARLSIQASASGLSNGVYQGTVVIESSATLPQTFTVPVTLVVGQSSSVNIGGVSNSFSGGTTLAPGALMSVYGTGLAPSTQPAARLPLPLAISGISATVNGVSAPILYVGTGGEYDQINIQVPYETGAGTATLGINNNGRVTSFAFPAAVSAPGVWPHFQDTGGSTVTSAKPGDTLTTYITGEGDVTPTLATGAAPSGSDVPEPRLPLALTVGGVAAEVKFAGIPTWSAGVTQVNFTVPANAPTGPQSVVIKVGDAQTAPVTLNIQ